MGQDYSYSQPSSSSNSLDITSLLEAEAQIYADETDSSNRNAMPVQYPRQPEADDGIPTTCYCGAQPVLGCSYTPKDPYRRYFTCDNADDGDCHLWKWWEVAVMEEMREFQRQLSDLKKTVDESEQKRLNLEKTVDELSKKKAGIKLMVCLLVLIGLVLVILRVNARVKRAQLQTLRKIFETLEMRVGEGAAGYFVRFMEFANDAKIVEKILRSLTENFSFVVCSIEESKEIDRITVDDLQAPLQIHESKVTEGRSEEQVLRVENEPRNGRGRGRWNTQSGRSNFREDEGDADPL